ncbi:MAG: hypothetical protein AB1656_12165 [Candidatus Omnitrophota bacterium]
MKYVVDTNVPIVANGRSEQASSECVIACAEMIQKITNSGMIVIDNQWLIINEYSNKLNQKGQPGVGDAFLKWILTNNRNPCLCEQVKITPTNSHKNNFKEFPNDQRLKKFDPSDRKFVAVARAHNEHPPILQAVDAKWRNYRKILSEHDVTVQFLCPQDNKKN